MSNPTSVVTERRLGEFYQEILPYLGGSADAGFTPVGSVIAIMGVTAPANYLACNGQIVDVADYPELANYFEQQFGSKNKFGGNGTTTFAVPDLRGEFLRGTGTNSHANQGSGSEVGTHQNATQHLRLQTANTNVLYTSPNPTNTVNADSNINSIGQSYISTQTTSGDTAVRFYTARPTNTSILWCIATKDIYLNPSMDYSTSEKVVGKWIDGKTLYQKTFYYNGAITVTDTFTSTELYDLTDLNINTLIHLDGFTDDYGNNHGWYYFPSCAISSPTTNGFLDIFYDKSTKKAFFRGYRSSGTLLITGFYFTIQYTKTTS